MPRPIALLHAAIVMLCFSIAAASAQSDIDSWQAPTDETQPFAVLRVADQDFQLRDYELAAPKYAWFIEYVLDHPNSFAAMDLDKALSRLQTCSKTCPAAYEQMTRIRDKASIRVITGEDVYGSFVMMAKLNGPLRSHARTTTIFKYLCYQKSEKAAKLFRFARKDLEKSEAYELVASFLDPVSAFDEFKRELVSLELLMERMRRRPQNEAFLKEQYKQEVLTCIAILSRGGQPEKAEDLAAQVRSFCDEEAMRTKIDNALTGEIPTLRP